MTSPVTNGQLVTVSLRQAKSVITALVVPSLAEWIEKLARWEYEWYMVNFMSLNPPLSHPYTNISPRARAVLAYMGRRSAGSGNIMTFPGAYFTGWRPARGGLILPVAARGEEDVSGVFLTEESPPWQKGRPVWGSIGGPVREEEEDLFKLLADSERNDP